MLVEHLSEKTRDARHRREALRVLALEREHESTCRGGVWVGPPRDESGQQTVVAGRKQVDRVWAELLFDQLKRGRRKPNVGVILLPP